MAETSDEAQLIADGFGRVLVELEWYDGLRVGLVDINGQPHYFDGYGQYLGDEADEYRVWPASPAAVELEREQWAIYVDWNERQGAGAPYLGQAGIDARYDELDAQLAQYRQAPADARRLAGELRYTGAGHRVEGTGYWFRWRPSR
ncbi:hypothetical protein [Streptomyces zhihengii]|uniref:Uncharacterized protein n=1 Tax=Streptomyces zhihengii TaxID=1818004 RepID=A0ABS2V2J8_9ACTN|nr:hypothetical protein [Streptomyces zhihengii]MBM9624067.1 hypothetical protein [Streptomyces zhihengii]